MTTLAPLTGGTSLLIGSAIGASLLSYAGNKIGREMGETTDVSDIKKQKFGSKVHETAIENVGDVIEKIGDDALASALKTGATVGAQGVAMGVDKYAMHVKNPLGTYFKGMRNPEQTKAAFLTATEGLTPGTKAYTNAVKGVMPDYDVMNMNIPAVKQMPEKYTKSLLDLAPDTGTYLRENMERMPGFKSGAVIDDMFGITTPEPLKKYYEHVPPSPSVYQSPWESMPSESTGVNNLLDSIQGNNLQNDLLPEEEWLEYR